MTRLVSRREALGLGACASAVALLAAHRRGGPSLPSVEEEAAPARGSGSVGEASGQDASSPPSARPRGLVIPAIDLDEPVKALGLTEAGEIGPPSGDVQWYTGSVPPGETGIAVIAGHVSSPRPDVFRRLDELRVGDHVEVTDASGEELTFVVERTKDVDKQALTRDRSVWGEDSRRMLVLITCDDESGVSDGQYRGNTVVWTEAAGAGG